MVYDSMRGKNSYNKFFKYFPKIILNLFQGSELTKSENIELYLKQKKINLHFIKIKTNSKRYAYIFDTI